MGYSPWGSKELHLTERLTQSPPKCLSCWSDKVEAALEPPMDAESWVQKTSLASRGREKRTGWACSGNMRANADADFNYTFCVRY